MNSYPQKIVIEEQGLRDGLQSEKPFVPTHQKLERIEAIADAGLKRIQVTSFVHPKLVPQMADVEDICKGLNKSEFCKDDIKSIILRWLALKPLLLSPSGQPIPS